jgi:hypothetical protein
MNWGGICYRHIRFGYPTWAAHLLHVYIWLKCGGWRVWFRTSWLRRVTWQHIPHAFYERPTDDCSKSLACSRILGVPFIEYVP